MNIQLWFWDLDDKKNGRAFYYEILGFQIKSNALIVYGRWLGDTNFKKENIEINRFRRRNQTYSGWIDKAVIRWINQYTQYVNYNEDQITLKQHNNKFCTYRIFVD